LLFSFYIFLLFLFFYFSSPLSTAAPSPSSIRIAPVTRPRRIAPVAHPLVPLSLPSPALSATAYARRFPPPPGLPRSTVELPRPAMEEARAELALLCALLCVVLPSSPERICTASPASSPTRSPPDMGGCRPPRSQVAIEQLGPASTDRTRGAAAKGRGVAGGKATISGFTSPKMLQRARYPGEVAAKAVLGRPLAQLHPKQLMKLLAKLCQMHPKVVWM
jgi:hypothetical protein